MNDAQLRCFHVAATEGSITRAAFRLGISQPTVSSQIKALEEGYGVQLFRRVGRKIALTDFGAHLRAITERIYTAQDEARELLVGHQKLSRGHLRVGAVSPYQVLPILQQLATRHPDVTFSLRAGNSSGILDALTRYDIDVGVMADLKAGDDRLHIQFLRRDDVVLIVNSAHRLAGREVVTYADLAGETVILREQGSVTRSAFMNALLAEEVAMPRLLDIESREATKEAVACGLGIAPLLLSEAGEDKRWSIVRIASAPGFDEYVACPRDLVRAPLIKAFLEAASIVSASFEASRSAR